MDKCTLHSDRILINRPNVATEVTKRYDACKKFFLLEVEARVVAATLTTLGLDSIDQSPTNDVLRCATAIPNQIE